MDKVVHSCTANKYQVIKSTIGGYEYKSSLSRPDAVLINRLRIGHTGLIHSYLLSGDDQPVCAACQINILSLLLLKMYLIISKHRKSLILLQKLVL